ncbi:MAG: hypothetical protein RLZZ337_645 [Bacteroidota bacterium]|jgi:hypothetical protein
MTLTEGNNEKKSKMWLFIMILGLFLINLGLIYKLVTKNKQLETTTTTLQSTEAELAEVESLKADLEFELDKFKGQNASLDSVISVRDAEIQAKVRQIKSMLSKGNLSKADLEKAKAEIAGLRSQVDKLTAEIEELSKENQYLKDENYVMQKQVEAEKEKVAQVEEKNTELNKQVQVGSRIFLKSLNVKPMRDAVFGDFKPTDKLNKVDKLEISYTLANNDLAENGERMLYFQVVTPNKSTLTNEKAGSGTFNYDGGERVYTVKKVVNFQNKNESGMFSIPKTDAFTTGKYTINVYSETHKMGSTDFTLR